jgi:outer membrane protein assembly factor BamB
MKRWFVYFAVGVTAVLLLLSSVLATAQVAVTTYHNDNYRSGANTNETILTPSNVNEVQFGKLHTLSVTGYVYGQPLYVPSVNINGVLHNVVYAVTEHDQAYAFDANTGRQLWEKNFLISTNPAKTILPISGRDNNCYVTGNEIGITSSPVIDITSNEIYLVAATKEIVNNVTTFYNRMHVLDIRTGVEKLSGPYFGAAITAKVPGTGSGSVDGYITFDPRMQIQRAALTFSNGLVFVAWAGYCDFPPFHGYVMAFNKNTLQPSGVFVTTPNGFDGGIWNSGSGAAVDSSNNIYLPTGNGFFDAYLGGSDYGDSILRLLWAGGHPVVTDYFTPWNQAWLNLVDHDVASGGVLLLPDQPGAPYPHLLVQCGKEGTIDLVNRDNMGHFHAGGDTQIVQTLPYIITEFWGSPAMWNNNLYFGGQNAPLEAFYYNPETQQIQVQFTSQTAEDFTYPGPTPSVSANGVNDGIVWIFGSDSIVRAYDANNLATELYNSNQNPGRDKAGTVVQFVVPTVADGMVFVGAKNEVDVYGLLK